MKATLLFIIALTAAASVRGADGKDQDLVRADSVEIIDERLSDLPVTPIKIVDPNIVQAVVGAIPASPAMWRRGSFTAPSGYLRFIFRSGSNVIDGVGLGDGFLVRGGGGDWESKKISKEIENKLASFAQIKKPNQSPRRNVGTAPFAGETLPRRR
jgi:hypothetical protein